MIGALRSLEGKSCDCEVRTWMLIATGVTVLPGASHWYGQSWTSWFPQKSLWSWFCREAPMKSYAILINQWLIDQLCYLRTVSKLKRHMMELLPNTINNSVWSSVWSASGRPLASQERSTGGCHPPCSWPWLFPITWQMDTVFDWLIYLSNCATHHIIESLIVRFTFPIFGTSPPHVLVSQM